MEVNLRGDGCHLKLDVLGYESERWGQDSYDDNWISCTVTLEVARPPAATFKAKCSISLQTTELLAFQEALRCLLDDLTGAARFSTIEDQVEVTIRLERGKGTISPAAVRDERTTPTTTTEPTTMPNGSQSLRPRGDAASMTRLIIGALALVLALGASTTWFNGRESAKQKVSAAEPAPQVIRLEAEEDIDSDNLPALIGFANHVFKGRVIEQSGVVPIQATGPDGDLGEIPQTQFDVEVLEDIEGRARGTLTVNQTGGHDAQGNLVLIEDDPLLVVGETYMFVTRFDERNGWYSIVAPNDKAKNEFDTPAEGERLEQTYENAEAREIPYEGDPDANPAN